MNRHAWTPDEARDASLKRMEPSGTRRHRGHIQSRKSADGRYEYFVRTGGGGKWVSRQRVYQLRKEGRL